MYIFFCQALVKSSEHWWILKQYCHSFQKYILSNVYFFFLAVVSEEMEGSGDDGT